MLPTEEELELATTLGFDEDVLRAIKDASSAPIERALASRVVGDPVEIPGISTLMSSDDVEAFINRNQQNLLNRSYRAFWSMRYKPYGLKIGDELLVLKTTDEYDVLRFRQTIGSNSRHLTPKIISKLTKWKKLCTFNVVGAGKDWVALTFDTIPNNICAFAEEVYAFCPDSVEQGTALRTRSDYPDGFGAAYELCPRLSEKLESRAVKYPEIAKGVRLLAYEILLKRYLFLWWD